MRFRTTTTAAAALLFFGAAGAHAAPAPYVSLVKLVDTAGDFNSFTAPVINNNGQVAFGASRQSASGGHYYRLDIASGVASHVYNQPSVLTPQFADNGELAWQYNFGSNSTAVYKGSPGSVVTLDTTVRSFNGTTLQGFSDSPTINADGDVAYISASSPVGRYMVLYREAGASEATLVADTHNGPASDSSGFSQYRTDVNDHDQVAFMGTRDAAAGGGSAVWLWEKDGNVTTELASTTGSLFLGPSANEHGQVAYTVDNNTIWIAEKGETPTLLVSSPGVGFITLNNHGEVMYRSNNALYVADGDGSPVRAVGVGDTLDGSTINSLIYSRGGFNDAGDVVFWATMADGRQLLGMASVPEPGTLAMLGALVGVVLRRRGR